MASMPREHVVKLRAELDNAVVVRPGDKLVLGFGRRLNMAEVDQIRERSRMMLPDVELIIFDDITAMAVYRDEPQPIRKALPNADLVPGVTEMLRTIGREQ